MSFTHLHRSIQLFSFLFGSVLFTAPLFAAQTVVVLPVYEQPAANVVELLRPLLRRGSTITAHGNQLIINASTSELQAIREALLRLDQPTRQLLIEIRTVTDAQLADSAAVQYYRTAPDTPAVTQRVRTLDGQAAFIRMAHVTPTTQYTAPWLTPDGRIAPPIEQQLTTQTDEYGFYALPHLHGEQVTIDIRQGQESTHSASAEQSMAQTMTTVRGHLGEWLTLTDTLIDEQMGTNANAQVWTTQPATRHLVQLRVIELPH